MTEPATAPGRFRIYGRVCESTLSLAEVAPRTSDVADVEFTLGDLVADEPAVWVPREDAHGREHLVATAVRDDELWYRFFDGTRFRVRGADHGRSAIAAMPGPDIPDDTIRHFLVDDVLPELLAASGALVLHGAAVVFEGGAVVLLGGSGMGKSTLSALLSRRGFPLLADDCVVIDPIADGYLVQPGSCSVRLWDAGARRVLGDQAGGERVASTLR